MAVERAHVAVAMRGGVDSSVAAALLVERGYRVVGLMLRLWSEPGRAAENRCCSPGGIALAQRGGPELLAPGHYARTRERDGQIDLLTARDEEKDQSYVLSVLDQDALQH